MPNIIIGKEGVTGDSFLGDLVVGRISGTTLYIQDGVSEATIDQFSVPGNFSPSGLAFI